MITPTLHSIRPAPDSDTVGAWRVASALVPAAVADLTVTREEWRELSQGRALLLETIQMLQEERGSAEVRDLAQISGIGDDTVMASIVVSLANENLALVEGDAVRTAPALTLEGDRACTLVERDLEVAVIGSPPLPCAGVDCVRLTSLEFYESSAPSPAVDEKTLDRWRADFWDQGTRRLQLKGPLQMRLYVLEGAYDQTLSLADDHQSVRLDLAAEHPFHKRIRQEANGVLKAAAGLLRQFGDWDAGESTLRCTRDGLRHWWASGGRAESEVVLSGALDIAVRVKCRPVDEDAARGMLLHMLVDELDKTQELSAVAQLESLADRLRSSERMCGYGGPRPSPAEVEAVAWDSGRWELAYRMSRVADGL